MNSPAPHEADHGRPDPVIVSYDELQKIWMRWDSVGLQLDLQRGVKVVTMADGSVYEAAIPDVTLAHSGF